VTEEQEIRLKGTETEYSEEPRKKELNKTYKVLPPVSGGEFLDER